MGIFRRKRTDFDPDLWDDAATRPAPTAEQAWFEGEDPGDDGLDIATNAGARFDEADEEWLRDDPGDAIRNRRDG